jgi:hypothetical protein
MVAHAYNPSTWEAEEGGSMFEVSLGYVSRLLFQKNTKKSCTKKSHTN